MHYITYTFQAHDFKKKNSLSRTMKCSKNMLSKSILIGLFVLKNNRTIREQKSVQEGYER